MSEIAKDQSFPRDPDRTDVGVIGGTWTNTVTGVIWDYIGRYNIKAEKLMSVGYIWERHVGDNSSAGGGSATPTATAKAVNFRDYDGAILYSYTVDEAAALTELPPLPEHSGLACQGWNWSLDDIKAMGRAVEVGAMYITDDGKTRIYIHLEDGRTSPMLGCCPNGTVTVDWGDGTEPDTLTGTSATTVMWTPTHEYGAAGDYVIKLSVSGSVGFAGRDNNSNGSYLLRYSSSTDGRNQVYQNAIQKVEIGDSVTSISSYAFQYCSGVRYCDFTHHTAVPTLSDTAAFTSIAADCEFRVPAVLADEWKAATNWATYADKIVGV